MSKLEEKCDKLLDKGNVTYNEACKLKDIARKAKENYTVYLQAAEQFSKASDIYKDITTLLSTSENAKNYIQTIQECEVFSEYYLYEKEQCLMAYKYEERDIDNAKEHYTNNQRHLKDAISLLSRMKRDDRLERQLKVWTFFEKSNVPFYYSILAREAWDEDNVVEALDYYREAWEKSKQVKEIAIDLVDMGVFDPVYKRISIGNFIGMAANISASLSKLIYEKYRNNLTSNMAIELLTLFLDGYYQSSEAYRMNPEWDDYKKGSEVVYNNICNFLSENKKNWKDIYIEFQEEKRLLNIMKKLDIKHYNEIKEEIDIEKNKILKLWGVGSFWLVTFLIVFGGIAVLSCNLKWYALLLVLCFGQVALTVIGALILRTIDGLSEQNFIKLVQLAFQYQFKFTKAFSKVNKDNE